jgi:3-oxoacyl-[acyl-carrier protein] reductase
MDPRPVLSLLDFTGRVAIVTGAGRGIGAGIARRFAEAGAAVVVNYHASAEGAEETVARIAAGGGRAATVQADVTRAAGAERVVEAAVKAFGRLDVLVNNAAVRREADLAALSAEDWRHTLRVVLDGAFFCTQAALPWLKASGRGAIINIGGLTAHTGAADRVHVVTAKAGLVGMTRALAHDLAGDAVTVNCVAPGLIDTVRQTSSSPTVPRHHATHRPLLGRRGAPQDVAQAVVFLASDGARYVTGQVLHVNGGAYLGG